MSAVIVEVKPQTDRYQDLLTVAGRLHQAQYIAAQPTHVDESILLGAFHAQHCVGFIRCFIQVIGSEEGRPALQDTLGTPLREGYVEAFGVLPPYRRQGLGEGLQEHAIELCTDRSCYQIRSRSPIDDTESYASRLERGHAIQPSQQSNAYYFIKTLPQRRR